MALLALYHHLHFTRRRALLVLSALVGCVLGAISLYRYSVTPEVISRLRIGIASEKQYSSPFAPGDDFARVVSTLWKPYTYSINNDNFTTRRGREYTVDPSHHFWTRPLGKDVLILDVDTRKDDASTASFLDRENLTPRRAGRLSHYIYSLIHGYDYRFVHTTEYWHRHQTWVKVPVIKELLKTYKFVVFLDSDAVFAEPHVPLEWLFNLWNIHNGTLIAMAEDLDVPATRDSNGWVLWNSGFIIAQQSERTQELFRVWEDCPYEVQFPGCGHWSHNWSHEQAAFGNYVRYLYNTTDELRAIPCTDGNGSPNVEEKDKCGGAFVSHHWGDKGQTIVNLREMVAGALARQLKDGNHDLVFESFVHLTQNH